MGSKINARIGIGPMSSEVIEAVYRYSHFYRKQLMLIASKNQIDYAGGYVNGWTTEQYCLFLKEMKKTYGNSDVIICRDHCGPGFNGIHDLKDTYETIKHDIEHGFDLIHIDFCHFKGNREEKLDESKKAIEYALGLNPNILLEVGTDENLGTNYSLPNLSEIEKEISFIKNFCNPEFYVVQTGSLVKEINQVGNFNKDFVSKIAIIAKKNGIKIKEHNDDYLDKETIKIKMELVDAMNIAPQFGVVQTQLVITKCLQYGINFDRFLKDVYDSGKWKKWLMNNKAENKMLCSIIAGHYGFNYESYKEIIQQLSTCLDIKEFIINSISDLIAHYDI
ncbi:MAG: hypothetical protein UW64_C0003G0043 [Microgenomates group bacterium GW2011_GWC1_44_37]|uniref:Uncharacterized protein n=1 Tax=Candidatus Collierbacteria bacterium GW2011_GWB2_44_22 TaxID=1618387 RepID=A0A0G1HZR7_9BACT|nr:MAG: hypothetical protein UW31_C0005G0042 [Candidatus Collierbacteria bacterium GW2011_GWA2_44_13]KKT51478.1 MAG: hypothetical protein UW42_C0002G0011 [Candidatus Collierbacteria bacterium GW2011_GWB1_44_197]KKT52490.1 MAG: hypothetical protein UW44_C0001G0042 [Candidatus Collierbacteria bacterium GW2011_GWB2_44_22]KKT62713.1 MAG: hypothetical protein UW56_C0004G0026 [Candidatus Collierbacteria bacterium GW2011_GWD1_44_27]KKT66491.1 MAG: hypothetical protein UW58_C0007G0011 [Candidatus Colli